FFVRDGDIDESLRVIVVAAFEAQATLGHVLADDDVFAAIGMTDAGGVTDFDARVFTTIDADNGRCLEGRRRHGEDGGAALGDSIGFGGERSGGRRRFVLGGAVGLRVERRRV